MILACQILGLLYLAFLGFTIVGGLIDYNLKHSS